MGKVRLTNTPKKRVKEERDVNFECESEEQKKQKKKAADELISPRAFAPSQSPRRSPEDEAWKKRRPGS
jgi:hypothetical protein